MRAVFAPLPCPDSPLRRLDPRWKLAALALAVIAVAWVRSPLPLAVALGISLGIAALGRMPRDWLLGRLGLVLLVLLPFLIALPLLVDDPNMDREWGKQRCQENKGVRTRSPAWSLDDYGGTRGSNAATWQQRR